MSDLDLEESQALVDELREEAAELRAQLAESKAECEALERADIAHDAIATERLGLLQEARLAIAAREAEVARLREFIREVREQEINSCSSTVGEMLEVDAEALVAPAEPFAALRELLLKTAAETRDETIAFMRGPNANVPFEEVDVEAIVDRILKEGGGA